jgi:myosin-5
MSGVPGSGESYTVSQTQQQAVDARDAMARVLYGGLFDALVERINASFGFLPGVKLAGTISILDIFGFEHFKTNHFEQFCINYANEKLQVCLCTPIANVHIY